MVFEDPIDGGRWKGSVLRDVHSSIVETSVYLPLLCGGVSLLITGYPPGLPV